MHVAIWRISASSPKYLENCEYHNLRGLKENGIAQRLTGADILAIVKSARKMRSARGECLCFDCLTAQDIDDALNTSKE